MTTLAIGSAPVTKTADQLRAEQRGRVLARRALVGRCVDAACTAVLGVAFVLVLVAG
jgi:hypothetical protein